MSKYAPEPWTIQGEENTLDFEMDYWIQDANGENICSCSDKNTARLIAHAPKLLETLKSTRAFISSVAPHGSLLERVNAAIKAVRGEEV